MKTDGKAFLFTSLLVVATAFWGGGWVSAKFIAGAVSPPTLTLFRFIIAAVSVLPFVLIYKQRFLLSARGYLWSLLAAALFTGFGLLFFTAIRIGLPGAGGVLMTSTAPIFTYILSIFLFRPRLGWKSGLGLLLGFAGGFFMLRLWTFDAAEIFRFGNGLFLICAAVYAGVTVVNGRALRHSHFIPYMFWFFVFASLFSLPFSIAAGDTGAVFRQGGFFRLNLLYLSVLGMAYSQVVYFFAAGRIGSHRASNYNFLVPGFAVLFSFLFFREIPAWNTLTGGALSLSAVYILNRER